MIDVDIRVAVADRHRRFELAARFATDVPVAVLYGPSGAGKSLTLQAIAGLLRPASGHIRVGGRALFDSAAGVDVPAPRREVGYLFQNYALFPHLSVRQNVEFGLRSWCRRRLAPAQRERVDALLDSLGLRPMAGSRPSSLSGGQQQRVALARALAREPRLLLLDEPFAALNPMLRASLREELARIRRQWDIPMVMITHDVDDVVALADAVFVYAEGRIIRQIDVPGAEAREAVRTELVPPPAREETPAQTRLRALLGSAR
ncbi:ATP-binding cassette domain-containing protein [Pigmentiphaga soli]|uniref:ATP-binding cassette domain-containing protein n=1 Tax=Pigmentiphaga soli TaxID=1007095 RepID=A0ABP8GG41_9BURK